MGMKELGEKYGKGNGRTLVNRAIRAELPGGNELLDVIGLVWEAKQFLANGRADAAADKIADANGKLNDGMQAMSAEIARRYELKGGQ